MKRVIKMSQAWIAAFSVGVLLVGCGGGESSGSGSVGSGNEPASPGIEKAAVLSWSAPDSRVNGEGIKMAELDKYIIQYGQNADALDHEIVIADAQVDAHMTHKVSGLGTGVWYFTILVQDSNGLLSAPSALVNKEIKS
ncbi:fibronectin type III domain-containing protein [uncultured Marinobacter sp.]|uniref:fibronectin type III domain-containing protein n=1 Tax=uncultured Marinobacter sp. TaxID=187379 RepID=UPI002616CAF6|nr:fibronectin type III domain-containing protein [uncultured Marinobacter sp.]